MTWRHRAGASADRVVELLEGSAGEFELLWFGSIVQGRHGRGGQLGLLLIDGDRAVDPLDADRLGRRIVGSVGELIEHLVDLRADLGPPGIVAVVLRKFVGLV